MSRTKDWETYPLKFHDVVREGSVRPFTVDCGTEKEAKSLQGMLYAFHGALAKAATSSPPDPAAVELNSRRKSVGYKQEGQYLHIVPKDLSPKSKMLEKALAALDNRVTEATPGTAPSDRLLDLVKKMREETPGE